MQSSKNRSGVERRQAESLAKRVCSLKEPWRDRFLCEITKGAASSYRNASLETVARYLENRDTYVRTQYMLRAWSGS
jgi:hypothetical protein